MAQVKCSRFEGKVAIVTASSDGIGLGIALRLALEGASVCISSRKQSNIAKAEAHLIANGIPSDRILGLVCHVANLEHRKNLFNKTKERFGRIDILVSNAAVNPAVAPLATLDESAWDKLFETNVKASFLLARESLNYLSESGNIVFVSSIAAFEPSGPLAAYGITKTSLLGLTKAFAHELAPVGIRVNCVAPGIVKTRFSSVLWENDSNEAHPALANIPLGRFGAVGDIAGPVAFLCSDDADWITGETLVVAGGAKSRL
eukprot:TRINITY_DN9770_c0_g1_i1.p1 TRINITY_DN9770_c0_g1~~TRINITY_DN9770_c0_g1_i1.p1  ORF type:complete len:268 (+),score=54.18 TRINITY_DN9770_c0_g1_i1:25-804(+)